MNLSLWDADHLICIISGLAVVTWCQLARQLLNFLSAISKLYLHKMQNVNHASNTTEYAQYNMKTTTGPSLLFSLQTFCFVWGFLFYSFSFARGKNNHPIRVKNHRCMKRGMNGFSCNTHMTFMRLEGCFTYRGLHYFDHQFYPASKHCPVIFNFSGWFCN